MSEARMGIESIPSSVGLAARPVYLPPVIYTRPVLSIYPYQDSNGRNLGTSYELGKSLRFIIENSGNRIERRRT